MMKKDSLKYIWYYIGFLSVVWVGYRMFFTFSRPFDEFVMKPLIWLLPIIYFAERTKTVSLKSLGVTDKNLFPSIYFSLLLGTLFATVAVSANIAKYGSLTLTSPSFEYLFVAELGLSLMTAIVEELAFRGYVFGKLLSITKDEWGANLISSTAWTVIHVPIVITRVAAHPESYVVQLLLICIFGVSSAFIYARTKNIAAPILLHVLWQWPIILFR